MTLAEKLRQEGRQKGRQEGLQEGLQEGRQEGRQENRQDAILAILEVRLGTIPEGLVETIRHVVDPACLDSLQRASLTCQNFEDFAREL